MDYISFDIDGLNPTYCPNTGTPVPGGLTADQVFYLFENLRIKEALAHLETALTLNHADHFLMFEIKPELAKVHEITLAIEAFREEL